MKTKLTLLLIAFAMCLEGAFAKTIKILAIGNSFSEDAIEQNLHELAKAENIETVIGNLYIGGCPLKRHWENAEGNKPAYRYLKIAIDGKGVKTENERLADALSDEKWDYISLQQASGVSGLYSSYEPYLTNLVEYVKRHAPKAKIVWHQTWAYAQNSTHGEFPNYGNSQTQMYRMIVETAKTVMKSHKFSKIIPSGTAVQNARQTYIGDNMNRDGFHLNLVYGRYTAACAWFEAITGKSVVGNAYAPAAMDKRLTLTCQQAAHDAVKKPWDVTMQKPIQAAQTPEQAKAYAAQTFSKHDRLTPLAPGNLKLTGYFENDIQNSLTHWNKGVLPYAKIADFFRNGRAQFALGEMWGKAVLSGAMLYRYTGDQQLKAILQATVKDILTTVRENGSISCVPVNEQPDGKGGDLWERKYVLLALTAYYTYVEATPEVLEAMKGEANSIVDQIGDAPKHDILEQGWSWNGIESSSVLEPMMRMYEITGDKRYLEFSEYVIGKGGCRNANIFTQALENIPPHEMASGYPKAYEMNSVFNGLVEYYRMTGIGKWKQCFRNYFNNIKRHEITIVGNGGADEPYYPKWAGEAWDNTQKEQANPKIQRMMETCIGVSWMKFCSYVLRTTADASAADYIEKYIYNGLLGAMKPGGDGFSYVNLLNGNKVTNQGWGWNFDGLPVTCCNLNGPTGLAYIPYVAVMQSKEGPAINLYNSFTAKALTAKRHEVEFRLDTEFPRNNTAELEITKLKAETFSFKLRIPSWSQNTQVCVNGKPVSNAVPGQYLTIERRWKEGDRISIALDMQCHVINAPIGSNPESANLQAVEYGPIVLSRDENTDASYNKPVKFITDDSGRMDITPVKPTLATTRLEYEVPTSNGKIRMTDYSSVNCWQGKKICTWIPRIP